MSEENLEPGLGADNPDNSGAPETKTGSQPQSLWGELSDEQKSVLSKKGLKNPADAVKSYMELEKQASGKFSIPEDGDAEALAKIYKKLGRPDDVAGYDLKDIADIDKSKIDDFKAVCLKNNLLPAQAAGLYNWYKENQNKMVEEFNKLAAKEIEEVREEWGADFDRNSEIMKRGFRAAELSKEQLESLETALGSKAFMQMGKRLGDLISEKGVPGLKNGKEADDDDYEAACEQEFREAQKKGAYNGGY